MILIDASYFTGELAIPNIPVNSGDASGVALALQTVGENNLDVFADKYILDYFIRLIGREMATKFLEETDKPAPEQIWIDIKNQLLFEFGSYKASPLANYVYFMVMRDAVTKTTQAGEADPTFDHAWNVSANNKMIAAWNEMAKMTCNFLIWYWNNSDAYKDYIGDCTEINTCSLTKRINSFGI